MKNQLGECIKRNTEDDLEFTNELEIIGNIYENSDLLGE